MKFKTKELIEDLIQRTSVFKSQIENLKTLSEEALNWKANAETWSVLENIEHLNRYGYFYVPEIRQQIQASKYQPRPEFKSGWLGNYFAKSMLPKEKLNKMNTFKNMNPNGSDLDIEVIDICLEQQDELIELLKAAQDVDLAKIKTGITISNWVRLRLGDTFRVVIYHNQRHQVQIKKTIKLMSETSLT